jgi:hypothetical protein
VIVSQDQGISVLKLAEAGGLVADNSVDVAV